MVSGYATGPDVEDDNARVEDEHPLHPLQEGAFPMGNLLMLYVT
jgi:hypothetical protein